MGYYKSGAKKRIAATIKRMDAQGSAERSRIEIIMLRAAARGAELLSAHVTGHQKLSRIDLDVIAFLINHAIGSPAQKIVADVRTESITSYEISSQDRGMLAQGTTPTLSQAVPVGSSCTGSRREVVAGEVRVKSANLP